MTSKAEATSAAAPRTAAIQKLRDDPRAFFKLLSVFDNNQSKLVPFVLTPTQEAYLRILESSNRIVIVKARQLGISTVTRAWFLWKAWRSGEPLKHAVISYTRESANHLHSIDKAFYISLPQSLQRRLANDSKGSLKWADTGSELKCFSAGGKGGATRSYSFTSAHISEFAFFDDQNELLSNVISSVGGGQIVIETTVKEADDFYHNLVRGAPDNGWTLAFFPWHKESKYASHPRFGQGAIPKVSDDEKVVKRELGINLSQLYWRRQQIASLGLTKFCREFPSTIDEAFYTRGESWLSLSALQNLVPLDMGRGPDFEYEEPIEGQRYVIGVDPAGGTGGDYSVMTVVSVTTGQPVYHWAANDIPPFKFAEVVFEEWERWNEAHILVESNGIGAVVISALEGWGVPLWKDDRGRDWKTDKTSKIRVLERLREALEGGAFKELHKTLVDEILNMVPNKWGSAAARKGKHDDFVMSFALALEARDAVPDYSDHTTRRNLIDQWKRQARAHKILNQKIPFKIATYASGGSRAKNLAKRFR